MSPGEVQDFCKTILPYQLPVRVKIKNDPEIHIGKIKSVDKDNFKLVCKNNIEQSVRFAFVARITNA